VKIALVDIHSDRKMIVNKDLSGGFGTSSLYGKKIWSKILMGLKRRSVCLPILAFGYVSAILKNRGFEITAANEIAPDVEMYIIYSSSVEHTAEINFAKKVRTETKARVGFAGALATVKPELFTEFSDFVIVGEPESFAMNLSEGSLPAGIIKSNPIENLDLLPFPDWEPFSISDFCYKPYIRRGPFFPVLSSRGCPYSCTYYCPYSALGGTKIRKRSVGNVLEEIEYLVSRYGAKGILLRDPVFTFDRTRVKEIAEGLQSRGIEIEWACETHLRNLDFELIDTMFKSGLRGVNVGIEAIDEEVLKRSKRVSADAGFQKKIIDYCENKGIKIGAFYIIGSPADTEETINHTIDYAKKLNTSYAQFTVCTPYPGTKFYEDIRDKITEKDWNKFDIYTLVFKHSNLSSEMIESLKEKAYFEYYFRPQWMWKFITRSMKRWFL